MELAVKEGDRVENRNLVFMVYDLLLFPRVTCNSLKSNPGFLHPVLLFFGP